MPEPAVLELGHLGLEAVAQRAEGVGRLDGVAGGVDEAAHAHHDAMALGQAHGRPHEGGRHLVGALGVAVGLHPVREPLAGVGVEQHDRRVVVERRADVGDRRGAGRLEVEVGDLEAGWRRRG